MQCGQLAPAIVAGKGAHQYLGDTQVSFVRSLKKAAAWDRWVPSPGYPHPLTLNVIFSCSGVWASPGTWKQPPQRQIHNWGWVGMGGILFLGLTEVLTTSFWEDPSHCALNPPFFRIKRHAQWCPQPVLSLPQGAQWHPSLPFPCPQGAQWHLSLPCRCPREGFFQSDWKHTLHMC